LDAFPVTLPGEYVCKRFPAVPVNEDTIQLEQPPHGVAAW
jgi:hypothetical protein